MRNRPTSRRGQGDWGDAVRVHVTRHAVERYLERARDRGSDDKVRSILERGVRDAIWGERVEHAGGTTWIASLPVPSMPPAWAVLQVTGPAEKPSAVVVLTILADDMVERSFGKAQLSRDRGLAPGVPASRAVADDLREYAPAGWGR